MNLNYNESTLGSIKIVGEKTAEMPMWSINHYIDETCNNYNKVLIIRRICELIHNGAIDRQFIAVKRSYNLFPSKKETDVFEFNSEKYVELSSKQSDPEAFWHIIVNYVRPIIIYRENGEYLPLVDYKKSDAIKITSLNYNSPVSINFTGALEGLIDLINVKFDRNKRTEKHSSRLIREGIQNTKEIIEIADIINDTKISRGVKKFANQSVKDLMKNQLKLNERIGLSVENIKVKQK